MEFHLNNDRLRIASVLREVAAVAEAYYNNQQELSPSRLEPDLPTASLPRDGIGAQEVLKLFAKEYAPRMANSAGPRYFGFVTGGSTPAAVAGDWLVSVFDQVMSGSNDSVAHSLERQTISFLAELFWLEGYDCVFVTGATMSNFVSLATARQWIGEQYGKDFSADGVSNDVSVKVLSASPHSSILKSLSMLGLGRNAWIKIDTLPDREAIDPAALRSYLQENPGPVIVVANTGTVNTVDFDDLEALADLKKEFGFFLHVDAAFGGFATVVPEFAHFTKGINAADTVTIDAHKWLNVPYDSAMQFTRHQPLQVKVFQNNAAYLGKSGQHPDNLNLTPENSRRFRALPAWFSLLAYGRKGYEEIVRRNCSAASELGRLIDASPLFRLLAPVRMNVVCFTLASEPSMEEVRQFLNDVRDDGRVFFTPTLYKNTPAIRAAISNWQTTADDTRLGFEVLCHVYQKMTANLNNE